MFMVVILELENPSFFSTYTCCVITSLDMKVQIIYKGFALVCKEYMQFPIHVAAFFFVFFFSFLCSPLLVPYLFAYDVPPFLSRYIITWSLSQDLRTWQLVLVLLFIRIVKYG
jgi:hypothetical protein